MKILLYLLVSIFLYNPIYCIAPQSLHKSMFFSLKDKPGLMFQDQTIDLSSLGICLKKGKNYLIYQLKEDSSCAIVSPLFLCKDLDWEKDISLINEVKNIYNLKTIEIKAMTHITFKKEEISPCILIQYSENTEILAWIPIDKSKNISEITLKDFHTFLTKTHNSHIYLEDCNFFIQVNGEMDIFSIRNLDKNLQKKEFQYKRRYRLYEESIIFYHIAMALLAQNRPITPEIKLLYKDIFRIIYGDRLEKDYMNKHNIILNFLSEASQYPNYQELVWEIYDTYHLDKIKFNLNYPIVSAHNHLPIKNRLKRTQMFGENSNRRFPLLQKKNFLSDSIKRDLSSNVLKKKKESYSQYKVYAPKYNNISGRKLPFFSHFSIMERSFRKGRQIIAPAIILATGTYHTVLSKISHYFKKTSA